MRHVLATLISLCAINAVAQHTHITINPKKTPKTEKGPSLEGTDGSNESLPGIPVPAMLFPDDQPRLGWQTRVTKEGNTVTYILVDQSKHPPILVLPGTSDNQDPMLKLTFPIPIPPTTVQEIFESHKRDLYDLQYPPNELVAPVPSVPAR